MDRYWVYWVGGWTSGEWMYRLLAYHTDTEMNGQLAIGCTGWMDGLVVNGCIDH